MNIKVFDAMLHRIMELADLPLPELRRLAEEDEALPRDRRSRGLCVSRIIDREFFDKAHWGRRATTLVATPRPRGSHHGQMREECGARRGQPRPKHGRTHH